MKKQLLVGRNLFFSAFFALSGSCWAAYAQSGTPTVSETYIELTTKNANDPLEITVKGASYADACWIDLNGNNTYDGASEDAPRFYKRLEKSIASVRIYGNVGELSANRTNIVKIDLTHNPATLKEVSIKENKELSELDLSKSAQLKSLEVDGCEALTQLSFPEGAKLTLLSCGKSGIKELDLKNLKDLEALMCGELGLTTLDVSMLEKLTNLSCFGNKLAKLDISNNKKLFSLKCDACEMEELVLGDVSSLKSFSANNNKLKTIDVSKLTQISKISLQDNLLESIVVAKEMSRLEDCRIYNNKLSARAMMSFIEQLPKKEYDNGSLFVINTKVADKNVCTKDAVAKAKELGWTAYDWQDGMGEEGYNKYEGSDPVEDTLAKITVTANKNDGRWRFLFNADEEDKANCFVDLNGDGKKDAGEEINNWSMYLDANHYTRNTSSVTIYGNITAFSCGSNDITEVDASANPNLKVLRCTSSPLEKIDMTKLPNLKELMVSHTDIASLDLSKNTALQELYVSSCKNLKSLNVTANTNLRILNVAFVRDLKEIDLSKNAKLTTFFCDTTSIKELDFSNNPELDRLECAGTGLKKLVLKGTSKLRVLHCNDNPLGKLDVSECAALEVLHAHRAQLTEANLSGLKNMTDVWLDNNKLSQLDVKSASALRELDIRNNEFKTIDLSGCKSLENLFIEFNKVEALDLSKCEAISVISCFQNNLKGEAVDALIASLPQQDPDFGVGTLLFVDLTLTGDNNKIYEDQVKAAAKKAWTVYDHNGGASMAKYPGEPRGLESVRAEEVTLYPVPADVDMTLTIPAELVGKAIAIYDATGAKVREFTATAPSMLLSVEDLNAGVYVLSIGSVSKTFVVR